MPTVCNDGLKLAQRDSATPTPALVQTESYGHPLAALPQPLLEASLVGLKAYCNCRLRYLPNLAGHRASKHMYICIDLALLLTGTAGPGGGLLWEDAGSGAQYAGGHGVHQRLSDSGQ